MVNGKLYTLHREQWIEKPLKKVFPFFERPENLALITPPDLGFRLLTPSPVPMEQGRIIDYTINLTVLRVRWRSIISTYDPPRCFVDEQLLGPYSYWHHRHSFRQQGKGTLLTDEVRYMLPVVASGPVGAAIQTLYVRPMLKRIFDFRAAKFDEMFGGRSEALSPERTQTLPDSEAHLRS